MTVPYDAGITARRSWVLCVSGDENELNHVRHLLPRSEFPVTWASDTLQARALLAHTRFDLLIIDMNLADGHGLPLLDTIRSREPMLPIVMLSSPQDDPLTVSALQKGATGFVSKAEMDHVLLEMMRRTAQASIRRPGGDEATNAADARDVLLIKLSERVYRNVLEVMNEGCLVVNARGEVALANPALGSMRGEREGALPGRSLFGLFDIPTAAAIREELFQCVFKGRAAQFSFDGFLQRVDDEPIPTIVSGRSLFKDDGQYEGCVLTVTNVSRLKAAEDRLKRLNDAKSVFLRTASHDLRTPLAVMKCALDNVLDEVTGPVEAEQRQQLAIVQKHIGRMERMINDLLDLSRIEAGMFTVEKRPIGVEPLLGEIAETFQALARDRRIDVIYHRTDQPTSILADEERMAQVLNNLLGNALRFAHSRIDLATERGGNRVKIMVSNDGPAIPAEQCEQIFEPFFRASTGPGAGLGLAIVRGIITAFGGTVALETPVEHGRGVRFVVAMPAVEAPAVTP